MHAILNVWIKLCQFTMYNIQNAWCSFSLFCDYWFEINTYNMHYTRATNDVLIVNQRMVSILNWIMGSSSGCQLNCSLAVYLKVLGCPLSRQLYLYMEVVGSLCMANSHGQPTELPTVSIFGRNGHSNFHGKIPIGSPLQCSLSCSLFFIFM